MLLVPATYAFTASAGQQEHAPKKNKTASWEHLAMPHDGNDLGGGLGKQIIRLGDEGWQLVCVTPVNDHGTTEKMIYYFKRPKQ